MYESAADLRRSELEPEQDAVLLAQPQPQPKPTAPAKQRIAAAGGSSPGVQPQSRVAAGTGAGASSPGATAKQSGAGAGGSSPGATSTAGSTAAAIRTFLHGQGQGQPPLREGSHEMAPGTAVGYDGESRSLTARHGLGARNATLRGGQSADDPATVAERTVQRQLTPPGLMRSAAPSSAVVPLSQPAQSAGFL